MLFLTQRLSTIPPGELLTATLDYQTRTKSRARITLSDGQEAGLMLERGKLLRDGDVLSDETGTVRVRIVAANEEVSQLSTDDALALATACYHLGNRHVPLQIEQGRLAYQHDHVLDEMVRGLGLAVQVVSAPFEPVSGAYEGGGHSHSHSHAHSGGHGHG